MRKRRQHRVTLLMGCLVMALLCLCLVPSQRWGQVVNDFAREYEGTANLLDDPQIDQWSQQAQTALQGWQASLNRLGATTGFITGLVAKSSEKLVVKARGEKASEACSGTSRRLLAENADPRASQPIAAKRSYETSCKARGLIDKDLAEVSASTVYPVWKFYSDLGEESKGGREEGVDLSDGESYPTEISAPEGWTWADLIAAIDIPALIEALRLGQWALEGEDPLQEGDPGANDVGVGDAINHHCEKIKTLMLGFSNRKANLKENCAQQWHRFLKTTESWSLSGAVDFEDGLE